MSTDFGGKYLCLICQEIRHFDFKRESVIRCHALKAIVSSQEREREEERPAGK